MDNIETLENNKSESQTQPKMTMVEVTKDVHYEIQKIKILNRIPSMPDTVKFLVEFFKQHQAA